MPDDLKITYIKLLRQRFNAPDNKIGEMMGVSQRKMWVEMDRLGLCLGRSHKRGHFDKEGWNGWINRIPSAHDVLEEVVPVVQTDTEPDQPEEVHTHEDCTEQTKSPVLVLNLKNRGGGGKGLGLYRRFGSRRRQRTHSGRPLSCR